MALGTRGLLGAVARQGVLLERGYGREGPGGPGQQARLLTLQMGREKPQPLCWGRPRDSRPQIVPQGGGMAATGQPVTPCCAMPHVPCRDSEGASSRAFLPPRSCLPAPLSLLPRASCPRPPAKVSHIRPVVPAT